MGPVLGAILTLALNGGSVTQGIVLLSAYSAGLAIPFLIASVEIGVITIFIRRYGKISHYVEMAMGAVLIVVGVLLFSGKFETIAGLGSFFGPIDELRVGRNLLIGFILLVLAGLIPAFIASRRGRNFIDWWFFGVALFPIALPMSLLLKLTPPGEDILPLRQDEDDTGLTSST